MHCMVDVAVGFRLNVNRPACNPLPPTTLNLQDNELESDG
jgi:hypothetical protein